MPQVTSQSSRENFLFVNSYLTQKKSSCVERPKAEDMQIVAPKKSHLQKTGFIKDYYRCICCVCIVPD